MSESAEHTPLPGRLPPPPPPEARRVTLPLPTEDDIAFIAALRRAGVATELDEHELGRAAASVPQAARGPARRAAMLVTYYAGGNDEAKARSRILRDRWFCHREDEVVTAQQLVGRLAMLAPEVPSLVLERIGGGPDGQLVLRAGTVIAAVVDDYEEALDTNEVDLRGIDDGSPSVTIRGLVRALNTHLARAGVRERLVPLRVGESMEVYVAMGMRDALDMASAGLLEDEDPEELLELASW